MVRETVPESELEEGDEEPQEVEPKRPRLAAPGKLEEEHDYVAELGKYALRASQRFHRLGFSSFVDETRGRSNNITDTVVGNISHPASGLLDDLRRSGAPVEFSSPALDADQLEEALEYGSHGSCLRGLDFIGQETMDFVRKGFYAALPYDDVKELGQFCISLSPMGLIPQRDRRDRVVVDYSFYGLNEDTVPLAPDSMQFGQALQRVLQSKGPTRPFKYLSTCTFKVSPAPVSSAGSEIYV